MDLTILRLGLSGQRREVAEATRWLDEDDRELLALWWQEAAGELTRVRSWPRRWACPRGTRRCGCSG